ncbi:MAG: UvrD-helicase domain-containing protein [Clostridiales bacterium]|nr:UvrD-helicase domain-containing protein [Clostridiales bacterium]
MGLSKEQQLIVDAPCGNILVSAAAGSGKTTVMTERIVKRILDHELSVENVLVMTFTNAAAANMSAKLDKKLREKLAGTKDAQTRKYLSEQIAALPSAYISTIDSFCSRVISNFSAQSRDEKGNVLLEPKSAVLDDVHGRKLLREAFDEVFSDAYSFAQRVEQEDELKYQRMPLMNDDATVGTLISEDINCEEWSRSFLAMVAAFGSGRDDTGLKEDMADKLSYLRSLPDYFDWVKTILLKKKKNSEDFLSSSTYHRIISITKEAVERRIDALTVLRGLIPDVPFVKKEKDNEIRQQDFLEWCNFLEENGRCILTDPDITWDEICEIRRRIPSEKLPSYTTKSMDPVLLQFDALAGNIYELAYILAGVKKTKDFAESLKDETRYFFGKTLEEIREEQMEMFPIYERYFEMVFAAERVYQQKKRQEHAMDFSDQEQIALSLIKNPEVCGYYRELFDEIYIDEYQDNSGVQDAIVQCFCRNNVFFVGDVKQSIYRFRHAKPQMFLDRCELYRAGGEGKLFTLNNNFRSVPGILSSVNTIFSSIMSEEYADIEYDSSHALHPGLEDADYPQVSGADITLILAHDTKPDDETSLEGSSDSDQILDIKEAEKVQKEALIVAGKIEELKKQKDFSYDQCVILTTSNRGAMAAADILMKCGIPAQGPSIGNILTQPDLRVMLDLARLADNIYQDIPLAGVMKSKIRQASFTDADLLSIYLFSNHGADHDLSFSEKVMKFAREDTSELSQRVRDLLSFINDLRTYAMQMTMTKWLEHVYAATGYPAFVLSQDDGDARYYALMALVNWATRFDMGRRSGLRAFVGYIDELDQGKDKSTEIDLSEPLENVVRCMTIHKSKGLEFPYVFLCGIQSSPRSSDTQLILSEKGDLSARRYLASAGSVYEPHDYYLLAKEEKREAEAERIRLLYVALTRAERKVFVISLITRTKEDKIEACDAVLSAGEETSEKYPAAVMYSLKTHLTRLMGGLIRVPEYPLTKAIRSSEPIYYGDLDFSKGERDAESGELALISDSTDALGDNRGEKRPPVEEQYRAARNRHPDVSFSEEQNDRLSHLDRDVHEWAAPDLVPSKTTVSEMKRILSEEPEEEQEENIRFQAVNMLVRESDQKWKEKGYTASQMGTLLHSVWQYVDFTGLLRKGETPDWKEILQILSKHGMIDRDQIDLLSPFAGNMQMFYESEILQKMAEAETRPESGPYREIPFALAMPNEQKDFSLVQGMIDCWFLDEDGQAVLIDYKSDRLSGTAEEKKQELKNRYQVQLDMYAQAITAATERPVKKKIIWLIRDGLSFEL